MALLDPALRYIGRDRIKYWKIETGSPTVHALNAMQILPYLAASVLPPDEGKSRKGSYGARQRRSAKSSLG